jgi:hypothetical protein
MRAVPAPTHARLRGSSFHAALPPVPIRLERAEPRAGAGLRSIPYPLWPSTPSSLRPTVRPTSAALPATRNYDREKALRYRATPIMRDELLQKRSNNAAVDTGRFACCCKLIES